MFSLIVTLIGIALVAALAAAAMYYGGSSFVSRGTEAKAAQLLNESTQIRTAALAHHAQTTSYAADVATLVSTNYLQASPSGHWSVYENAVATSDVSDDVCIAVNAKKGVTGIPKCDALTAEMTSVCCELP